ncbi:hypothetical protein BDZ94DRAFT_1305638 [Collybia nuda]|uniref:Uncharacterized protein n=1 Tax=Collybia nuda TaxID=64659 RepID=A0A9P5YD98_9AGAR|nr:hypothetical protein BDZ94DRAFT_1305638 [Collybia nuda]
MAPKQPTPTRHYVGLSTRQFGLLLLIAPQLLFGRVAAVPLSLNRLKSRSMLLEIRDSATDVTPKIWIPILVITAILAVLSLLSCQRDTIRERFTRWRNRGVNSPAMVGTPGTREITAEQLAGTINGAVAPAGTTGNRTRRTRRPRRTPSQISTTSLPAYNKEPGEEELVIFRGPQDMEDAGMPTAVVMPSLSEDGEDSVHSRDNLESDRYAPMPTSPNNQPLLQDDNPSHDQHEERIHPTIDQGPRQSAETLNSSEEANSLMRVDTNAPEYIDPRGEAPAYFEAVDMSEGASQPRATLPSAIPTSPPTSPSVVPQRRSGFRTLLSSLPNRISMHGASVSHSSHIRADSSLSMVSSDISHERDGSRSQASHRATPSGSGSLLGLSPFRTLSRQKSINNVNLNSPSLISLNSISSPLTHTVVRTEFTYPKAGPTPEQLKLISSRESFARFGKPYGPDAIAFAASASRQDLDGPPPDFDMSNSDTQQIPGSAGPSRLRTTSNAADQGTAADDSGSSSESETEPVESNTDMIPAGENPPLSLTTWSPSPGPQTPPLEPSDHDAPPTSFRVPSSFERSESRASSMQSYATAAESVIVPQSTKDLEDAESPPTTPRQGGQHTLEPTDTTITTTEHRRNPNLTS